MQYERLTPHDLIETINMPINGDLTRFIGYAMRLFELENRMEKGELRFYEKHKPKYKVGDTVYFVHIKGYGKTIEECAKLTIFEFRIRRVYCGKVKTTYYLKDVKMGLDEDLLIGTREEAEQRLKELNGGV